MRSPDVVIVGAGVIGAAIAYVLSCSTRLRVLLIERGTPGCEASSAAAGLLAFGSGRARGGALFDLRRASARMFPELVSALQMETGIDVGYRQSGIIALAFSGPEGTALRELVRHRETQGLRCVMLEPTEVRSLEPAVNPAIHVGAFFYDDAAIDGARLVAALVQASAGRGVRVWSHCAVHAITSNGAAVTVRLEDRCIEAGIAVVAAGAWSGEVVAGCGKKIPLRPARGEMAALRAEGWQIHHPLTTGDKYLVPGWSDEVRIGSTMAFVGYNKEVTTDGIATLRSAAGGIVPQARNAALIRAWAGLRPCSTIRRPIIGRLPKMDNVILACGHHRSGILLAPITARMVTEMIAGGPAPVPLHPFSYRRH
jgi:glycine oxidase